MVLFFDAEQEKFGTYNWKNLVHTKLVFRYRAGKIWNIQSPQKAGYQEKFGAISKERGKVDTFLFLLKE